MPPKKPTSPLLVKARSNRNNKWFLGKTCWRKHNPYTANLLLATSHTAEKPGQISGPWLGIIHCHGCPVEKQGLPQSEGLLLYLMEGFRSFVQTWPWYCDGYRNQYLRPTACLLYGTD